MMAARWAKWAVVLALLVGLVPLVPEGRAAPRDLGTLRVFHATAPPDPTCHYFYYARSLGFYREAGLNVELNPVRDDLTAIRALLSGEGQLAWTGFKATLQAMETGAPLRVVSSFAPRLDYKLVALREISRPKELEGRTVAVSAPGAVSHEVPVLLVRMDGGDPKKVGVLSVGGSQSRLSALVARRVDAAALNALFADRALRFDYLHSIADAAERLPDLVYSVEVTTLSVLRDRREALQAFVNATRRAVLWFYANPDRAVALSREVLPDLSEADLRTGISEFARKRFWNASGELPQRAFLFSQRMAVQAGELKAFQRYEDVYLREFAERAQRSVR